MTQLNIARSGVATNFDGILSNSKALKMSEILVFTTNNVACCHSINRYWLLPTRFIPFSLIYEIRNRTDGCEHRINKCYSAKPFASQLAGRSRWTPVALCLISSHSKSCGMPATLAQPSCWSWRWGLPALPETPRGTIHLQPTNSRDRGGIGLRALNQSGNSMTALNQ